MTFREHLENRMVFGKTFIDRVVKLLTPALEEYDLYCADIVERQINRAKFQRFVMNHCSPMTVQRYLWLVNSWNEAEGRPDIEWLTPKRVEERILSEKKLIKERELEEQRREWQATVRDIMADAG